LFHDPQRTYAGGVYYITPRERLDVGDFRRHELRDGFARNIDDALLSPARIDGRDAFVVRGRFDDWNSALTNQGAHRTRPRGDIALAAIHLPNIVTLVVVLLVSEPGRLSRDPGPAFEIFGSLRFRDLLRRPVYEEELDTLEEDADRDRVLDANDKCPNEPETYNGVEDDDGCPDRD